MTETTKLGALHFGIKNTGDSSRRLGPCEVCGKDASEVYRQTVSQDYEIGTARGRLHRGDLFGHEPCLVRVRSNLPALRAALVGAGEF